MKIYNDIPIFEFKLLVHNTVFTVLFLALLIASIFLFIALYIRTNSKESAKIKKLKDKAENDPYAQKQLDRLERKRKRNRSRNKENPIYNIFVGILTSCLLLAVLFWAVIPGWTDYAKKDYVVYSGSFEVTKYTRRSYITIEDGTTVYTTAGFDEDDKYGTIVYSKRTRIALGGE